MNRQDAKDSKVEPSKGVDKLARSVIGAAIEVHRHLGPSCLESLYEEALSIELDLRRIPFERQKAVAVNYMEMTLGALVPPLAGLAVREAREMRKIPL